MATSYPNQRLLTVISLLFHYLIMRKGCVASKSELSSLRSPTQTHQIPVQGVLTFPCFFPINEGLQELSWSDNEWRGGSDA